MKESWLLPNQDNPPNQDNGFEDRLKSARQDAGLDFNADNERAQQDRMASYSAIARGMRIGLEFVGGIVIGIGIGYFLDEYFETAPIFLIIFLFLGFGAGLLNVYKLINNLDRTIRLNSEQQKHTQSLQSDKNGET